MRDAIGHSSISLFRSCGMNHRDMLVKVTIGVQDPSKVDAEVVAASLPRGNPKVEVVHGGLNIADPEQEGPSVIASASVEAFLEVEAGDWQISEKKDG